MTKGQPPLPSKPLQRLQASQKLTCASYPTKESEPFNAPAVNKGGKSTIVETKTKIRERRPAETDFNNLT